MARASGRVLLSEDAAAAVRDDAVPKGHVISAARLAGILAAKRTPDLIPLCHPVSLHGIEVDLRLRGCELVIDAEIHTEERTGVEMEALNAVSVAGLTAIDMVKSIDPAASLGPVELQETSGSGGRSWVRPSEDEVRRARGAGRVHDIDQSETAI